MSFFKKLFGERSEDRLAPNVKFGRYSDSYKDTVQYDAWDQSLGQFEAENFLQSVQSFFKYLRDDHEDNVSWTDENGQIQFELYQGSKKLTGSANAQKFTATAKVAKAENLNIGFMRRLVERNFDLKYSRFALDNDNDIVILFDTHALDGSPYKLYYALKEVATNADKQDDLLLEEFDMLEGVESSHTQPLPQFEKEAKYGFILQKIHRVFDEIDNGKLKPDQYPGAVAYLLLDLNYRLDYLVAPEGFMMELLERNHRQYFEQDGKSVALKTAALRKEFEKLLERPAEALFREMYLVKSTFGITAPVNHDRIVSFIDGELYNMDWYNDNGYHQIAMAIPGYIVGYSLFNYAIPKPDKELFHLYFQITEQAYFQKLGFEFDYYDALAKVFNRKNIKAAIENIAEKHETRFPKFRPDFNALHFDSLTNFAKSYLLMVRNLDLTKVE